MFRVHIRSVVAADGEEETIEAVYPALYDYSPDRQVIEYTELEDGLPSANVRITAESCGAVIERLGTGFVINLKTLTGSFDYQTPAGEIEIRYRTVKCSCALTPSGGRIDARYLLSFGGGMSKNTLTIEISEEQA